VNMFQGVEDRHRLQDPQQRLPRPLGRAGDHAAQRRVLTVRAHEPNSHKNQGWEDLHRRHHSRPLADRPDPVVFVLWGGLRPRRKGKLIDAAKHPVLTGRAPLAALGQQVSSAARPFLRHQLGARESSASPPDRLAIARHLSAWVPFSQPSQMGGIADFRKADRISTSEIGDPTHLRWAIDDRAIDPAYRCPGSRSPSSGAVFGEEGIVPEQADPEFVGEAQELPEHPPPGG